MTTSSDTRIATPADPITGIRFDSMSDEACALLGFQRTRQITRRAQKAWETGERAPLLTEARERRNEIIEGALSEVYKEYLPLKAALTGRRISHVCDIGCGQGLNDLFLLRDHAPRFTLVDIEETPDQYHFWADTGAGYASLDAAAALLVENGCAPDRVVTVNPRKREWQATGAEFDLVTSLISCGFHYPIDDYLQVFLGALDAGGCVCLDLRRHYLDRGSPALERLLGAARMEVLSETPKSVRALFRG